MDQATNQQCWKDGNDPLIVSDYNARAAGRQIDMIDSGHKILVTVRDPNTKGNEGRYLKVLANITNHRGNGMRNALFRQGHARLRLSSK
jgi:hypothetical protein